MAVVETHVEGRIPGRRCWDEIILTERWVAVVDQSTPKTESEPDLIPTVRARIESFAPGGDGASIVSWINDGLAEIQTDDPYRPCVTIAVVDTVDRVVTRVGDCHVVVDDLTHEGLNPVDEILGSTRALVTEILRLESAGQDPAAIDGRREIVEWLRRAGVVLRNHPDSPFGFGALDGSPLPDRFVETFDVSGARRLSIMTDGYPVPRLDLAHAEHELGRLLHADRSMTAARATKGVPPGGTSFDDRAFVSVRFDEAR